MYNQTNQPMNGTENNMNPAYQPMQPGFSYYENSSGTHPFMDPAAAPDISFMTVGDEDSAYALQPDPSCKSATLPHGVVNAEGSRFIEVPDFDSMTKYMMSVDGLNKRTELYGFLNKLLHTGQLSEIVGFQVQNQNICGNDCILERFNYWELCRDAFIVDIAVKLKLKTRSGEQKWSGVLVCWGGFHEKFDLIPEELVESTIDDRRGFVPLDSHLIQVYRAYEVDIEAERLWEKYGLAEALKDPSKRKARKLAERMGLTVLRLPIYEHKGLSSILFFEAGTILVGADRIEKDENGNTIIIKDDHGEPMEIPANTIVINENRIEEQYEDFPIFHECFHYEKHFLAFRLQKLTSSDTRFIKKRQVPIVPGMNQKDYLFLMENYANRGAYALWMPASDTRRRITERVSQISTYKHKGELYELVGASVACQLSMPHFRMRARMIQLGYLEAKGILHYVERKRIRPFAFDPDSLRAEELTFLITPAKIKNLCKECEEFRAVVNNKRYVYAEGHMVFNSPMFVQQYGEIYKLTDFGIANVDVCCLRFVRIYVQKNLGEYVLGRMYMDAEYVERTLFYLNDMLKQPDMNNFRAKKAYKDAFPVTFKEAVDMLKSQNAGTTYAKMAEYLHMDDSTFQRALTDPRKYKNEDFIMALCLYFKLPDWISELLFKRAHVMLDPDDERHAAMLEILRARSCDGMDAAQEFLRECGVDLLNW